MPKTAQISTPQPDQIKPDLTQDHGDNGPSRDDLLFFAGQFKLGKDKIKEAQTANKKIRQAAKLRGIEVQILDHVMAIAEEEDDTEIDRLRTFKTYAQAFDLPIGSQLDLFGAPAAPTNGGDAQQTLEAKAYRTGRERGVMGLNPDDQAYPPALPEGQKHMEGWNDGQAVLKEKFVKLNEDIAAKEAKKQAKAGEGDGADETKH